MLLALASAVALTLMASPARAAATFTVNITADTVDEYPGDGMCADADGNCTLRAAIQEANALSGRDTINVPAGTYTLTIDQSNEPNAAAGDLDLTDGSGVAITGAGPGSTIIDAGGKDRAFEIRAGTASISGVTVRNGNSDSGGGIFAYNGTLNLDNAVVSGNTSGEGGGITVDNGTGVITNSTISGNTAGGMFPSGGGISNIFKSTMQITNSTISSNTAGIGAGGGINSGGTYNGYNKLTLTHVTLNNNSADNGDNLRNVMRYVRSNEVNVRDTIIANPVQDSNCSSDGPITSQGFNLEFPGTSCGFTASGDIQNQDPKLGLLQNNGGPTQTHALQSGSAAIDAVSSGCPPPSTDQRGITRPQDGDNNGSALCDIGAFELEAAPVATDDSYGVNANQTLAVPAPGVLANDTDPRGQPLTAKLVLSPSHGAVNLNPDGSFLYAPSKDFSGTDTFTYQASDATGKSNTATVTITVSPPNSPPVANDDAYSTAKNKTLNVAAPGVLKDDTEPNGKALTASQVRGPSNGTLTLNTDGSFAYTPNKDFSGTDTFTYKASDGASESNVATVSIAVKPVSGGSQPPSKGHHKKGHHKKGHHKKP